MRTAKSIKRSFPKATGKLNLVTGEVEDFIFSMEKRAGVVAPKTVSSTSTATTSSSTSSTFQPTIITPRRTVESGMDTFRNMARDIKKKR